MERTAQIERRGPWMLFAGRLSYAALLALALVVVALIALAAAVRYPLLLEPCIAPDPACSSYDRLTPADVSLLAQYGLSPTFHAAYHTAQLLIERIACWLLAALILWRHPREPLVQLTALMLLTIGNTAHLDTLGQVFPLLWWPGQVINALGQTAFYLGFCLFPNGRFAPRWLRWPALANLVFTPAVFLLPGVPINPMTWPIGLRLGVLGLMNAAIIAGLVVRYRRYATTVERQQLKWLAFGFALSFILVVINAIWLFVFRRGFSPVSYVVPISFSVSVLAPLVAIAIAILRYRLFDIDLILNRTLVYGTLTASVVGLYILVVGGLGALLQAQASLALSLLATGVTAVLFQPLREHIQRAVNRLLYGQRAEPYAVVARLGGRLEVAFEPTAILPTITQTLAESLRLPYVAIGLDPHDISQIAAATGEPLGTPVRLPLQYQGAEVGHLLVSPRRGEVDLSPADRRLLADLAQQAGAAVHGVRLMADLQRVNADLRRSREQLVLAREEERRRLRRDLHDDLAPTLAGLALTARTIHDLIPDDPAKAAALAGDLYTTTRDAVGTIRRLVYDLRPPELDELGLLPAIRARATQYSGSRGGANELRVVVEGPDTLPPLPAAVEVAAYRIVQEALMNVAKHAQARTCFIRLALADELQIEIADDGVGLSDARSPGVGLRSMHERAAELGGTCEIGSMVGGGTRIGVRLPVKNEAEHEPAAHPDR